MEDVFGGVVLDVSSRRAKALIIHERLCQEYHCPIGYFHSLDPLSELVSSLLSHRTKNADSGRAFRSLTKRFKDWNEVCDAPTDAIQTAIEGVTWPEQKAPRIKEVLRRVRERTGGTLDLSFLGVQPEDSARAWLEELPGVGPKTSAAVLCFSTLRKVALPVDSHHHRVAVRTGLIDARVAVGPSHALLRAQLPADWSAQDVYDNHEVMMIHGQKCCFFRDPACTRCVLHDLCPTGQARLSPSAHPANPDAFTGGSVNFPPNSSHR